MANKFKKGDTVRLKSGGPIMTVSREPVAGETGIRAQYGCDWFRGANAETKSFEPDVLEAAQPPGDAKKK